MKFLFLIFFTFNLSAQTNTTLEALGDTCVFYHQNQSTFVDLSSNQILYWSNGNIGLVDIRDSSGMTRNMLRFYKTGELSLSASNYSVAEYIVKRETSAMLQFHISGDFRTYYRNGKLRSYYTIPQIPTDTISAGNYKVYNLDNNGKLFFINEYKRYAIYNGIEISLINEKEFYLSEYKKGKIENDFIFIENRLYHIMENEKRKEVNKARYKKYKKIVNWVLSL